MKKCDLLLPAGNMETFFAAIDGGADSIYAGIDDFNARNRAKNFSLMDLKRAITYAHTKKKRVNLTLNSLIKEQDIPRITEILLELSNTPPDGIIVQDLGLAWLIKNKFPEFNLHASTQLTVHNLSGLKVAAEMGFKKVVLSRELGVAEIKELVDAKLAEIEVFIHGALCFSWSGQCTLTSYTEGVSANMGRCSQACRRKYTSSKGDVFPFSSNDLNALDSISALVNAGVDSLKVEGRMKSASYVYTSAKAYRAAIDGATGKRDKKEAFAEAREILETQNIRRDTRGFVGGANTTVPTMTVNQVGSLLGRIKKQTNYKALMKIALPLSVGDRVKKYRPEKDSSMAFTIEKMWIDHKRVSTAKKGSLVEIELPQYGFAGDSMYKAESSGVYSYDEKQIKNRLRNIEIISKDEELTEIRYNDIMALFEERISPYMSPGFEQLNIYNPQKLPKKAPYKGEERAIKFGSNTSEIPFKELREYLLYLPRFLEKNTANDYKENLNNRKVKTLGYILSNISHFDIVPKDTFLIAGSWLYCLNSFTVRHLKELSCSFIMLSSESNREEMIELINKHDIPFGMDVLYRPELLVSKVRTGVTGSIKDLKDRAFEIKKKDGYSVLLPAENVDLRKLFNINFKNVSNIYPVSDFSDLKQKKSIDRKKKKDNDESTFNFLR